MNYCTSTPEPACENTERKAYALSRGSGRTAAGAGYQSAAQRRPDLTIHRRRLLSATLAACGPAALGMPALAQSERRIVLGQSAALTGPAAQLGIQFQHGARLAFDRAN